MSIFWGFQLNIFLKREISAPEADTVGDIVKVWRAMLSSISWFMRCLNQPIAQQANLEDKFTAIF